MTGYQWVNPEITPLVRCGYDVEIETERFTPACEIGRFRLPVMTLAKIDLCGGSIKIRGRRGGCTGRGARGAGMCLRLSRSSRRGRGCHLRTAWSGLKSVCSCRFGVDERMSVWAVPQVKMNALVRRDILRPCA